MDHALTAVRPGAARTSDHEWVDWSDEQLLDIRMCDLGVQIEGSWLEDQIATLYDELAAVGLTFQPHCWLSDEWFTPDHIGGVAIPFYLTHPRLAQLEASQMLEVEGGTETSCLKILRHEVGHAVDNAYRLRRRRRRQQLFGRSSTPYPDQYVPRPYSRSHVVHLPAWYAQSHPDEDFAETFAVWLTPGMDWRRRYADWPAIRKLEYMDQAMKSIAGRKPLETTRRRVDPLERLRRTLRQHYKRRRKRYGLDHPDFYDRELRRVFTDAPEAAGHMTAARFIASVRKETRRRVAAWTGAYQYQIDQVIEDLVKRCRELNLRVDGPEEQLRAEFTILLTVQTMNAVHSGGYELAL